MVGAEYRNTRGSEESLSPEEIKGPAIDRIMEPTLVLQQAKNDAIALAASGEWSAGAGARTDQEIRCSSPIQRLLEGYYIIDFHTRRALHRADDLQRRTRAGS